MSVDDISQLLRAWSDGDQLALDELTPIVYAELRRGPSWVSPVSSRHSQILALLQSISSQYPRS